MKQWLPSGASPFQLLLRRSRTMTDAILVVTTLPSEEQATQLAASLIEQRLAACAQVSGPITSYYRWQGVVETAHEFVVAAKTIADRYPELEHALRAAHPYEQPEILAMPFIAGSPGYLNWLRQQVTPE